MIITNGGASPATVAPASRRLGFQAIFGVARSMTAAARSTPDGKVPYAWPQSSPRREAQKASATAEWSCLTSKDACRTRASPCPPGPRFQDDRLVQVNAQGLDGTLNRCASSSSRSRKVGNAWPRPTDVRQVRIRPARSHGPIQADVEANSEVDGLDGPDRVVA
jgi:hypothetical protein